ncbi:F-box protein FBW2 [Abeliophyllum distichum]|uniref:F-box protein FBW2 n=1 Tax=Abeliophyllum distichum TaxID=126358 RepID=A0ABD1V266_9LAMI
MGSDFRRWDELIPDTLGLIFKNLPLREVLTVIPRVCKSWGRAVMGPYCWLEIDIDEWSRNRKPEIVDRMLQLLIGRSCGSPRKLCVSGLSGDESTLFIANHAKSLQTLRLPRSEINDSIVEKVAGRLSTITVLDLSYCINIGAQALEAIGRHCKFLTSLRRIMHPLEVINKLSQDDEALAIAKTMPRLKQLEIAYLLVVGPVVVDCYDMNGWDNCSDYSSSSGYLAWDFVAGDMDDDYGDEMLDDFWEDEHPMEDVEMWFYDDVNACR